MHTCITPFGYIVTEVLLNAYGKLFVGYSLCAYCIFCHVRMFSIKVGDHLHAHMIQLLMMHTRLHRSITSASPIKCADVLHVPT